MAEYKISFTLEQDNEGIITPSINMSSVELEGEVPEAFQQMFDIVNVWLFKAGVIDEEGNILDEDNDFIVSMQSTSIN